MHLCKKLLDDGYIVYGIDDLNEYYDPLLKRARLSILSNYSNFTFNKVDICNFKDIKGVFKVFKPEYRRS